MTHSRGPWFVSDRRPNLVIGQQAQAIADCKFTHSDKKNKSLPSVEECKDNAKLIAAAPDMLALLKKIRQWDQLPEFSEKFGDGPYWMHLIDEVLEAARAGE